MCCLSTYEPRSERFLDKETFKTEILKVFEKKEAESLVKYDTYHLGNIFDYEASYWSDTYGRGFVSLADALTLTERLEGDWRTLKLKDDFDHTNRCKAEKAAEFIEWIKEGLKAICNDENPGKRS